MVKRRPDEPESIADGSGCIAAFAVVREWFGLGQFRRCRHRFQQAGTILMIMLADPARRMCMHSRMHTDR